MGKLQIALDGELDSSLRVLEQVAPYVDIVEIGTPLILREGMNAVRRVGEAFPALAVLADFKIMDAGEHEAAIAFEHGCKWVTVLGVAHATTVRGVVTAAERYGGQVMVDMLQTPDLRQATRTMLDLGCHVVMLHTAFDLRDTQRAPFADLAQLRAEFPDASFAIAGGIQIEMTDELRVLKPAVVVVGGAITNARDPGRAAEEFKRRLE